jgi:hypothetical protein
MDAHIYAGYFINYAATIHVSSSSALQYRIVQATPLMPTALALIGSIFLVESPRYLATRGKTTQAREALAKIRNRDQNDMLIAYELSHIEHQVEENARHMEVGTDLFSIMKATFKHSSLRGRLLLAWTMQAVAQWSGGQGISFYIPEVFSYAGVASSSASLISSGAYGIVKLVVTMVNQHTTYPLCTRTLLTLHSPN